WQINHSAEADQTGCHKTLMPFHHIHYINYKHRQKIFERIRQNIVNQHVATIVMDAD
ncbi:hypothetical protein ISN44_As06g028710, partial [Arabidopsis suecica]